MRAVRIDERPHCFRGVDGRVIGGAPVVGEALDLNVAKHAMAWHDEAVLVHQAAGAGAVGEAVHLAAWRKRDEAQIGVVVADEHVVSDVDPPEEAVVGEDAVLTSWSGAESSSLNAHQVVTVE
jgi:hypothetical protein